jgi:ribosomal protein S18 acetylase RimI-like enzyme
MEALVARGLAGWLEGDRSLPGALWVADGAGAHIAGCIGLTGVSAKEARLRWFCVDGAARGAGLGSALLGTALGFARDGGYGGVVLETNPELTGAARLYRAAGFVVTGSERTVFCGREVEMQWYALEL